MTPGCTPRRLFECQRYSALHFRGPGTDLRVGLADDHLWMGGGTKAGNGAIAFPTCRPKRSSPRRTRIAWKDGDQHQAALLSGHADRRDRSAFEGGRVVEAQAPRGEEVLQRMIDTDEGARRLGEVALVPHSSPIAASGLLFWNTLVR